MPHHTLLHIDSEQRNDTSPRSSDSPSESVSSNAAASPSSMSILMMCRVMIHAPDGSTAKARLWFYGLIRVGAFILASLVSLIAHRFKQLPVSIFHPYVIQRNSV